MASERSCMGSPCPRTGTRQAAPACRPAPTYTACLSAPPLHTNKHQSWLHRGWCIHGSCIHSALGPYLRYHPSWWKPACMLNDESAHLQRGKLPFLRIPKRRAPQRQALPTHATAARSCDSPAPPPPAPTDTQGQGFSARICASSSRSQHLQTLLPSHAIIPMKEKCRTHRNRRAACRVCYRRSAW